MMRKTINNPNRFPGLDIYIRNGLSANITSHCRRPARLTPPADHCAISGARSQVLVGANYEAIKLAGFDAVRELLRQDESVTRAVLLARAQPTRPWLSSRHILPQGTSKSHK